MILKSGLSPAAGSLFLRLLTSIFCQPWKKMGKVVEWWCRQRAPEAEWREIRYRLRLKYWDFRFFLPGRDMIIISSLFVLIRESRAAKRDNLQDHDEEKLLDLQGNSFKQLRGWSKIRCSYSDQRQLQQELLERTAWSKTWITGRSARAMKKFHCRRIPSPSHAP